MQQIPIFQQIQLLENFVRHMRQEYPLLIMQNVKDNQRATFEIESIEASIECLRELEGYRDFDASEFQVPNEQPIAKDGYRMSAMEFEGMERCEWSEATHIGFGDKLIKCKPCPKPPGLFQVDVQGIERISFEPAELMTLGYVPYKERRPSWSYCASTGMYVSPKGYGHRSNDLLSQLNRYDRDSLLFADQLEKLAKRLELAGAFSSEQILKKVVDDIRTLSMRARTSW